jgi:hypothetical protein
MASLFHGGTFTGFCEAIVAAAFVVVFGIGALFEFFDEALFEEALYGAVERARAEPNLAAGAFSDFLHDGITVAIAIREGNENVECVTGKKKGSHGETISGFAIANKGVFLAAAGQVSGEQEAIPQAVKSRQSVERNSSAKRESAAPCYDKCSRRFTFPGPSVE